MAILPSPDEFYTAIIDRNGDIMAVSSTREYRKMGIDIPREKQLLQQISDQQEVIDNYYNKLLELGVIQPVKTPEEIAHEAAQEQLRIAREQAEQFKLQAEQQAAQFQEQMQKQAARDEALLLALNNSNNAILKLNAKVEELESNGTNGHSGANDGKNASNIGGIKKKPGGSKISSPTGDKTDTGHPGK